MFDSEPTAKTDFKRLVPYVNRRKQLLKY